MNCEEFLDALDRRTEATLPSNGAWEEHGLSCPSCALALNLEKCLLSAPTWESAPMLSPERRARVLARARLGVSRIPSPLQLLRESAVNSLAVLALLTAAAYFLAGRSGELFPKISRGALRPVLAPVDGALRGLVAAADPFLHNPAWVLLLSATAFAVCLASFFSARILTMRSLS